MRALQMLAFLMAILGCASGRQHPRTKHSHNHHFSSKKHNLEEETRSPCLAAVADRGKTAKSAFFEGMKATKSSGDSAITDHNSYCENTALWAIALNGGFESSAQVTSGSGVDKLAQSISNACDKSSQDAIFKVQIENYSERARHFFAIEVRKPYIQIWMSSHLHPGHNPQDGYTIFDWAEATNWRSQSFYCSSLKATMSQSFSGFLKELAELCRIPRIPLIDMSKYFGHNLPHQDKFEVKRLLTDSLNSLKAARSSSTGLVDSDLNAFTADALELQIKQHFKDFVDIYPNYIGRDGTARAAVSEEDAKALCLSVFPLKVKDGVGEPYKKCVAQVKAVMDREALTKTERTKLYFDLFSTDGDGSSFASSATDYGVPLGPFDLKFDEYLVGKSTCEKMLGTVVQQGKAIIAAHSAVHV